MTMGPALVADAVAVASTVAMARRLLTCDRGGRRRPGPEVLAALAPWLYLILARSWVLHWGASGDEVARALPGDELVPEPAWVSTRAIRIGAPVEAVWPWLAQMGQDRGGLYSYTWLENLAGLEFHNADRIHPEWQAVAIGDIVRFAPGQDTLVVAGVEPGRLLLWQILDPRTRQPASATWAFVLEPEGATRTRLIQRFRIGGRPRWLVGLAYMLVMEVPHFVMERAMLRGIRARAEQGWRAGGLRDMEAHSLTRP
ncbi:MAG TPA: SRPBCC family protein [Chloroflexota bacterium]|nr:SRPBCC family protein [Chloroflexota bacterium]